MKFNINHINEQLNQGIVPDELLYRLKPPYKINYEKLNYIFNPVEHIASRYPNWWQYIPGFEEVFERMSINIETLENEMIKKRNLNICNNSNNEREHSTLPQQ